MGKGDSRAGLSKVVMAGKSKTSEAAICHSRISTGFPTPPSTLKSSALKNRLSTWKRWLETSMIHPAVTQASGNEVSIVDVLGYEGFIKNMIPGVGGDNE